LTGEKMDREREGTKNISAFRTTGGKSWTQKRNGTAIKLRKRLQSMGGGQRKNHLHGPLQTASSNKAAIKKEKRLDVEGPERRDGIKEGL